MTTNRPAWPVEEWQTAAPDAHGIDPGGLQATQDHLIDNYPTITSLLVARGGVLVHEWYATGDADTLRNTKSATKSVLSMLVGIALDAGDLGGLDDTLADLLPARMAGLDDRRKRAITVRDLLTMRSGLAWEEWRGSTLQMTASPDWVRFVLHRPLEREPGTQHNYSTGDSQLLAAALQRATGMSPLEYADMMLFLPLGIERRAWPADPQGITIGGAELALRARDLARLGHLYLNQGRWGDEQIVPAAWVRDSVHAHANVVPQATDDCPRLDYGYLWWLRQQGEYDSFMAVGYGGQYIYVVPALDLVVVMTGTVQDVPRHFADNRMLCQFNLVQDFIVPAVE
jgi:CubicO group peptidase (beta-lactamase class C family)